MLALLGPIVVVPGVRSAAAADPVLRCEKGAAKSLAVCVKKLSKVEGKCYAATGAACGAGETGPDKAFAKLAATVAAKCSDDATVQAVGYGPALTAPALVDRMAAACETEVAAIVARSYGGPHAASLAAADDAGRSCLGAAYAAATKLVTVEAKQSSKCVVRQRKNGSCDAGKTATKISKARAKATTAIATACGDPDPMPAMVALGQAAYVASVGRQGECMTALAHPDATPLAPACGPRAEIAAPVRGGYQQIVLDEATFGTRCGDGSSFAFQIRLAPDGFPVENVVLHMQGGGVCIFEDDCAGRSADLFEALSDGPPSSGIMSNDPAVSPFANWTKVFLPYCTQDVFAGGGATSDFDSITVHRFGGINVRAALRYVRDVIWRELDATTDEGYRPDRVRMLFGGTSAGGFGTLYNYHYVLDDLQWANTTAWPDAALALDNGEPLGIASLGIIVFSDAAPLGWGARGLAAPYCAQTNCGVGPVVYAAAAPRLKAVPMQQFAVLSNQVDSTQVNTTFFDDAPTWIDAMRQSYCDTAGTNGLRYFLPAISSSTHVISTKQSLYTGYSVDGILMRDWLAMAVDDADNLSDAVEEGTLVDDVPGVSPFPCAID